MDDQQVFDAVAAHLLAQGEKSLSGDGEVCAYRGAGGLRCAVGCLIPDDRYEPDLECRTVDHRAVIDALPWEVGPGQLELLSALQAIHDWCAAEDWRSKLAALAEDRGLRAEVLERLGGRNGTR